jgi:hypothetical protein
MSTSSISKLMARVLVVQVITPHHKGSKEIMSKSFALREFTSSPRREIRSLLGFRNKSAKKSHNFRCNAQKPFWTTPKLPYVLGCYRSSPPVGQSSTAAMIYNPRRCAARLFQTGTSWGTIWQRRPLENVMEQAPVSSSMAAHGGRTTISSYGLCQGAITSSTGA